MIHQRGFAALTPYTRGGRTRELSCKVEAAILNGRVGCPHGWTTTGLSSKNHQKGQCFPRSLLAWDLIY
jgi:hypothetical protein